ncbi:hypothetical protein D3C87_1457450 [compost metagenome]
MSRTASTAATCDSDCLPVPAIAMTRASGRASQSVATPDVPPVRRLPNAKASITAASCPSAAFHKSSSGQVPPCVCAQVLVPTKSPTRAPKACRLLLSNCSMVLAMLAALASACSRKPRSSAGMACSRVSNCVTWDSLIQRGGDIFFPIGTGSAPGCRPQSRPPRWREPGGAAGAC